MTGICRTCGARFDAAARGGKGGRPRTRCERCRPKPTGAAAIDGARWRKLRAQVLREEPICCVIGCGQPSKQVDHRIPLKLRPDLAWVRSNLQGMCARHNASKGARLPGQVSPPPPPPSAPPRRWVL